MVCEVYVQGAFDACFQHDIAFNMITITITIMITRYVGCLNGCYVSGSYDNECDSELRWLFAGDIIQ